jgi:hypothetical protein
MTFCLFGARKSRYEVKNNAGITTRYSKAVCLCISVPLHLCILAPVQPRTGAPLMTGGMAKRYGQTIGEPPAQDFLNSRERFVYLKNRRLSLHLLPQ